MRTSILPRLSDLSLTNMRSVANTLFRGGNVRSGDTPTSQPSLSTPTASSIKVPTAQVDSTSSSSDETSSNESETRRRIPKSMKASSSLAMHPRKSVLSQL
jgi:hypothetical protein